MPEGYRHLAYIQTGIGYQVKMDMPMLKGPEVEALYARGARWLAGGALERWSAEAAAMTRTRCAPRLPRRRTWARAARAWLYSCDPLTAPLPA